MHRRVMLVKYWLGGRKNNVSLSEIFTTITSPSSKSKAKRMINKFIDSGQYWIIKIEGISADLYYPKRFSLQSLWQVIAEVLHPGDWHNYETEQVKVLPEDIVADCGAAEGLFSLLVAPRCKRVYAVEPHPVFANSLKLSLRPYGNADVIEVALGSRSGIVYLTDQGIASKLGSNGYPVKIDTIDNLFEKVTYLKADLEGYEMDMLQGARKTIERWNPKIAITTYHKPEHAQEIAEYLRDINPRYKVFTRGIDAKTGAPVMLYAWV